MPDPTTLILDRIQAASANSTGGASLIPTTVNVFSLSGITGRMGLRFQFPNLQFNDNGDVLDPPIFASALLRLRNSVLVPVPTPIYVYGVLDNQPPAFALPADFYLATTRLLPTLISSPVNEGSPGFVFDGSGVPVARKIYPAGTGTVDFYLGPDLLMTCMNKVRTGVTWTGYLNLIVTTDETRDYDIHFHANDASGPTLTVTYVPFHTGFFTDREGPDRATHSMRSGAPAYTSDLREDGYSDGIWVTDSEWDPDDPFEYDEYVPSGNEGSQEDEVPT